MRQFLFCLLVFIIVIIKLHRIEDEQVGRSFLGRTCMIVTILFFAAPFATIIHVMKVRNTESLPYHLIVSTFIVCLQWMVYGVLLKDPFIQVCCMLQVTPLNSHQYGFRFMLSFF